MLGMDKFCLRKIRYDSEKCADFLIGVFLHWMDWWEAEPGMCTGRQKGGPASAFLTFGPAQPGLEILIILFFRFTNVLSRG